jgi:hypothetical protein
VSSGGFLSEAGWFQESERVLRASFELCSEPKSEASINKYKRWSLEFLHKYVNIVFSADLSEKINHKPMCVLAGCFMCKLSIVASQKLKPLINLQ